jgi:putative NADPH-quinone reductase
MNILLVSGNPRKNGYTNYITNLVCQGIREAGGVLEVVDLVGADIHACVGCYQCWTVTPGVCRFHDVMPALLEKIIAADILLCATPLYDYTMSSSLKIFLERVLPLTRDGFDLSSRGLMRNKLRHPDRWGEKKLGYIAAGALKDNANFDGLHRTFDLLADGLHMTLCAALIRSEAYLMQFELAKPMAVKTVETALVQAGIELVQRGSVSEETRLKATRSIAPEMAYFLKYSTIYWEHAVALGRQAADLEKVQHAVVTDLRILMSEMARCFDSTAGARLKAVIQFDFPDINYHCRYTIDRGSCGMEEVIGDRYDLRVTVASTVWARVFIREINIRDALMSKQILLEGDKSLFTRLDRLFPPPVT